MTHPATFRDEHLHYAARWIARMPVKRYPYLVLDPFAGVGNIHRIATMVDAHDPGFDRPAIYTMGIELEDWPDAIEPRYGRAIQGDSREELRRFKNGHFDAIVTSPVFGNRMSDHHRATDDSRRNTYTHRLGRELKEGNAGAMHFHQDAYKDLHRDVWRQCVRVLRPGGLFVLNTKDFIRRGERVAVGKWHQAVIAGMGMRLEAHDKLPSPGLRYGENDRARVDHEDMFVFRKEG